MIQVVFCVLCSAGPEFPLCCKLCAYVTHLCHVCRMSGVSHIYWSRGCSRLWSSSSRFCWWLYEMNWHGWGRKWPWPLTTYGRAAPRKTSVYLRPVLQPGIEKPCLPNISRLLTALCCLIVLFLEYGTRSQVSQHGWVQFRVLLSETCRGISVT